MSGKVIRAAGVSKRYRLGQTVGYDTLRDAITRVGSRRRTPLGQHRQAAEVWALRDVHFTVAEGEVVGVIGSNGAGKSTLLKILARITRPTTGRIELRGRLASLLEVGAGFHPELTGRENVFLNGAILGMRRAEIARKFDEIIDFAGVGEFVDTPVKRYSSGMYVRLAFAVAAHLDCEILLVDEVLAVGDAAFQKRCLGQIRGAATGGRTVLFVSHNLAAVSALCQRALVLERGRLVCDGSPAAAIRCYLRGAATAGSSTPLKDREDRKGSGLLRFTAVSLHDDAGRPLSSLRTGSTVRLRLHTENTGARAVSDVRFSVGIENHMGVRVVHLDSETSGGAPVLHPAGCSWFDVRIPKLPLLPGRYGLTLFCSVKGEPADWIQEAVWIDVEAGDFFGTGRLPGPSQAMALVQHEFLQGSHGG